MCSKNQVDPPRRENGPPSPCARVLAPYSRVPSKPKNRRLVCRAVNCAPRSAPDELSCPRRLATCMLRLHRYLRPERSGAMRSLARLFGRSVHPQVARPLVLTRRHHLACPACRSGCFSADSTNCVSLVSYSAVLGRRRMGPHRGRVLLGFLGRRPPSIVLACYSAFLTQRVGASCSVATWHTRRLAFLGDRRRDAFARRSTQKR